MKNLFNKYILNLGCDWSNKSDVIRKVRERGSSLQYADYGLRDDFDVVEAAISENPYALEFASRQLRNDKKIALIAIESGSNQFISDELKNDKEFAEDVWESTSHFPQETWRTPQNILPPLYGDSKVWLKLAYEPPYGGVTYGHFGCMAKELTSNKEFRTELVKKESLCFQHASEKLRDDEELAELAVRGWANQLTYTSDRIKNLEKFKKIYLGSQIPSIGKESAYKQLNNIIEHGDPNYRDWN